MYCCWSCETVKVMKLEHLGWDDVCSLSEVSESDPDMLEISPGVKKVKKRSVRGWLIAKLNQITLCFKVIQLIINLYQNIYAVKKGVAPLKQEQGKKSCEIKGGGQEMAVMVG